MVCPTCGLENDPSSTACARCNTALTSAPARPLTPAQDPSPADHFERSSAYPSAPTYRSTRTLPLYAAAAAVLLIAIVAAVIVVDRGGGHDVVVLPASTATPLDPDPAPEPTASAAPDPSAGPSPHDQAVVIDGLLSRSVASRTKLNKAIDLVNRCVSLSTALSGMQQVGAERQQQLAAVAAADVSALPDGEQLRATLGEALRNALAADQAYVQWTEPTESAGCAKTAGRNAAYARGRSASTRAQAAKKQFLALWNPVAAQQGLPFRSSDDI